MILFIKFQPFRIKYSEIIPNHAYLPCILKESQDTKTVKLENLTSIFLERTEIDFG